MPVKVYDGTNWVTVAGDGAAGAPGAAATSSSITTWVKTASGGETSVSGTGDTGYGTLAYTVGQELVYLNGVLLDRGDDYTATNGTSITGLTALLANDVVTVWTVNSFSVANTYTIAQADAAFAPISVTGGMTLLSTTTLAGASTSVNITPTGYTQLQIFLTDVYTATNDVAAYIRLNGDTGNNYLYSGFRTDGNVSNIGQNAINYIYYLFNTLPSTSNSLKNGQANISIFNPNGTGTHALTWNSSGMANASSNPNCVQGVAVHNTGAAINAISFTPASGNWSGGTVYVYGVK